VFAVLHVNSEIVFCPILIEGTFTVSAPLNRLPPTHRMPSAKVTACSKSLRAPAH
jgi:hypothetical protein